MNKEELSKLKRSKFDLKNEVQKEMIKQNNKSSLERSYNNADIMYQKLREIDNKIQLYNQNFLNNGEIKDDRTS